MIGTNGTTRWRDRLAYLSISFKVVRDNFFVRFCCERSNTSVYMNGWHNLKRKEVHISIFHKVLRGWYFSIDKLWEINKDRLFG